MRLVMQVIKTALASDCGTMTELGSKSFLETRNSVKLARAFSNKVFGCFGAGAGGRSSAGVVIELR